MTTNLTAPQAPVTDEELDQMIWKLERDGGMTPKLLSLMRELREVRKAKGEPVAEKIPDSVYQVIYQECGGFVDCDANAQTIWNACRAAMLNAEKLNQPVSETNKDE